MAEVELRLAARPALVRTARQLAVALGRRAGLDDASLDEVRLAVGEATGLAVALAGLHPSGQVRLRYVDDAGLRVSVTAPGRLAVARGDAAGEVVSAAVHDGVGTDDGADPLPAGSALMVLASLAPSLEVSTDADGLAVELAWPAPG